MVSGSSQKIFLTAENERAARVEADAAHLTGMKKHVNWLLCQQKRGTGQRAEEE